MTISVILLTGKKFDSSKKIKDEPTVEPSFKVVTLMLKCTLFDFDFFWQYIFNVILIE